MFTSPPLSSPYQGHGSIEGNWLLNTCSHLTPSFVANKTDREGKEVLKLQVRYFVRVVVQTRDEIDSWETQEVWLDRITLSEETLLQDENTVDCV